MQTTTPIAPSPCVRASERGLSLVEVMVAMAIGLVTVLVATQIYLAASSNFRFRVGQSENLGNSRYVLGVLASEFAKAGYRRDPTQSMQAAFPEDAGASPNGCKFGRGQALYLTDAGDLCLRFQARDRHETDCAGAAAGIDGLGPYEAPPAPALGAGMFVQKYVLQGDSLVCLAGGQKQDEEGVAVADGVRAIHLEFGVGQATQGQRRVERFKTTAPTAGEVIRSLRYAVLLASSRKHITGGVESNLCARWAGLGGERGRCESEEGRLYQLASGSLTLRNLMP